MKNKLVILLFILFFSSCTKQVIKLEKKLNKLDHVNKYNGDFSEQKNSVLLVVKQFTSADCKAFFGVDVVHCGYQPIQLTISNFSNSVIYLGPTNISLPVVSPKKVAKDCHWKTGEIVTGAGLLAGIFYWPALIPTVYCGTLMRDSNLEISKKVIQQDIIQCWDNVTILPLENLSRIIFVANYNFYPNFQISLFSPLDGNLDFNVNLNKI